MSFFTFSQVITFECNNEIIILSIDEINNNPNAYMDYDGDGLIDENDFIIYLQDFYDCEDLNLGDQGCYDDTGNFYNIGSELFLDDLECTFIWCEGVDDWSDVQIIDDCGNLDECEDWVYVVIDCFPCDDGETMIFWEEVDEENCTITEMCSCETNTVVEGCWEEGEFYCLGCVYFIDECTYVECVVALNNPMGYNWSDSIEIDDCEDTEITWNDIDWIVSDWDDFDWESVWDELDLGTLVDWDNIPWDSIIDLNIFTEDFIDYIISIIAGGQPFNWNDFLASQGCVDDDSAIIGGLSGIGIDVGGCQDAIPTLIEMGYSCTDQLTIPGLGSIMPMDVCCATCEEINGGDDVMGCTDLEACNYNSEANIDDGSCDYGVQCLVSPCSVSDDPGIDGAYCVDDYCEGCCAFWYYPDGTLISNDCDDETGDESIVGLWFDFENDQYIEITEDVIGFYTFIEDEGFMCWVYWSMEYNNIAPGLIEVVDPEEGPAEVSWSVLDNSDLEIIDPEGDTVVLSSITELPELDMCDEYEGNMGCDDFQGQWVYLFPDTEVEVIWMEIDDLGADFFILGDDECVEYIPLFYDSIEGSDDCVLFADVNGVDFVFGQLSLNSDATLSFTDMPGWPEGWSNIWNSGEFNDEDFLMCVYGCTDPTACNYEPFANIDDGTCGMIDDCGDCQIPYCYTLITNSVEYTSEQECDLSTSIWIGNDCENNDYCLSSPENLYWNSGCVSIEENQINNKLINTTNLLGKSVDPFNNSGIKLYFYQNGTVQKKLLLGGERY